MSLKDRIMCELNPTVIATEEDWQRVNEYRLSFLRKYGGTKEQIANAEKMKRISFDDYKKIFSVSESQRQRFIDEATKWLHSGKN